MGCAACVEHCTTVNLQRSCVFPLYPQVHVFMVDHESQSLDRLTDDDLPSSPTSSSLALPRAYFFLRESFSLLRVRTRLCSGGACQPNAFFLESRTRRPSCENWSCSLTFVCLPRNRNHDFPGHGLLLSVRAFEHPGFDQQVGFLV